MQKKFYLISRNKFDKLYNTSEEIYGNICIIKMFCDNFEYIEDLYKILPIIRQTHHLTDNLYAEFINMKK